MNNSVHQLEDVLVVVIIQLIIIIIAARLAGSAAVAIRQPRAVGEIVAGLLLGPSFFGYLFPDLSASIFTAAASSPLMVLSQIGLILLMFQIGNDFEFGHLAHGKNKKAVTSITVASLSVPLVIGFGVGQISAPILAPGIDVLTYSLFVAVAFAITAVPILGRILREYSLTRSETGVIAISAAAANDVVGWFLLAGVSAYASAAFSPQNLGLQIAGLAALILVMWFAGRPLVGWLLRIFPIKDNKVPTALMAAVIALVFAAGIATQKLGIFTIFGGFLLGLLFHKHREFVEAWRQQIGQFVLVFFLPIFFTYTGLRTNILGLDSTLEWTWCGVIFAAAVLSKIVPVYFGARFSGVSPQDSTILGVLMNTRALMELIVLNIGLSLGFIPPNVFTMLVIMAVGTTVMTGPLLQLLLPWAGHKLQGRVEA
ncbi:MAG: cation:proton antiporter [Alphaproteobacteria bacterium]